MKTSERKHSSERGWLPDDELTRKWLQNIKDNREECDHKERGLVTKRQVQQRVMVLPPLTVGTAIFNLIESVRGAEDASGIAGEIDTFCEALGLEKPDWSAE